MTNLDIDRRLALAIGYAPEDVRIMVRTWHQVRWDDRWCDFDHRQWRTIGPIAARYKIFPHWWNNHLGWTCRDNDLWVSHLCPATCIALAVIEAADRRLL